jgi:Ran GTPase-activating protein (RanGAP) involved in mRNA processing and transport
LIFHSKNFNQYHILELLNDYQNSDLEKCIHKHQSNSWIDLSRQQLTARDMEIVVKHALINKKCKELDLRRNEINSDGIGILTDQLSTNQTLEILYLSFNFISDMGVYYLVESISLNNRILKKLELDSNEITDQGAEYLSQMLKTNQILIWLSLDNNNITNQGIKLIANVLSNSNQRVEELYINGNKFIDDQSINSLIIMIKQNQSIKKLSLENCGFTKKGKTRLQQVVKYKKNFSLNI